MFTDALGYPHNHDRVRRAFYKALDAAGVRQVVLYALRHTMATLVLHETKDLKLVAARLGHSNEMLVLRTCGHLLPGVDREAADRLGDVVRRRPGREQTVHMTDALYKQLPADRHTHAESMKHGNYDGPSKC